MNPELEEFQFEVEGYVFGRGCPVFVDKDGLSLSGEVKTQDSENSLNGTRMSGKDFYAAKTWTFGAHVDGTDVESALAIQEDMESLWKGTLESLDIGEHVPMRYRVGGRTRRVYGRPRRFEASPNNDILSGHIAPSFTFDQVDALHYDDDEQQLDLKLTAVNEGGGTKFPLKFPAHFIDVDPDGTNRDTIEIGGRAPTSVIVEFDGPITNPEVWVDGKYLCGFTGSVPADMTYIVDSRPWMNTAVRQDGVSVANQLSAKTWLSKTRLKPGTRSVMLQGRDDTGRARARVRWRNANYSL